MFDDDAPSSRESSGRVQLEVDNRVARITLNNPPLNVLTLDVMREISDAIHLAAKSEGLCAIVFESASGCRAFSAGIAMEEHRTEVAYQVLDGFHGILRNLNFYSKPTVAIVQDAALGAGCELAAFCDIVIASEKARFGLPQIKVGVFPTVASVYFPRMIGLRKAKELVLTGALLTAEEAHACGLVNYVVPEMTLQSKTAQVFDLLRAQSAVVLESARRAIVEASALPFEAGLAHVEDLYLNQLLNLRDPVEGLEAFLEKRKPSWKHK
jgi:enoyl-CoA hydratase/carnithine racemase